MSGRAVSRAAGGRQVPSKALLGVLVVLLSPLPGAFAGASANAPALDPCALLLDEEIRSVQHLEVVERIPSIQRGPRFHVLRCFYRAEAHSGSVSLALSVPLTEAAEGARRYWNERFHRQAGVPDGKRQPPLPLEDLGEEAFWVGDPVAGSIYVLTGDAFLRLSVGGAPDDATRRARSVALARAAVARIDRLEEPRPRETTFDGVPPLPAGRRSHPEDRSADRPRPRHDPGARQRR